MKTLVNISIAIYIIAGFALFLLPVETLPPFYRPILMGSLAFVSGALIYLPGLMFRTKDQKKQRAVVSMQAVIAVGLLINGMGGLGLYRLYQYGIPYDKLTHFITSLIFVIGLFHFIKDWFTKNSRAALIASAVLVFAGGVTWEFLEAFSDRAIGTTLLGGGTGGAFSDTLWDTIMNLAGIVMGVLMVKKRANPLQ